MVGSIISCDTSHTLQDITTDLLIWTSRSQKQLTKIYVNNSDITKQKYKIFPQFHSTFDKLLCSAALDLGLGARWNCPSETSIVYTQSGAYKQLGEPQSHHMCHNS